MPVPFLDTVAQDGVGIGQIDLAFTPERLLPLLTGGALPSGWTASIVDRAGIIVARRQRHPEFVGTSATPDYLENTRNEGGVWRGRTADGAFILGAYARVTIGGWRAAVGIPLATLEAPLRRSLWWVAGVGTVFTGLAASLALTLARRIEGSVGALAAAAAELGAGRNVPPPVTKVREINAVGAALAAAGAELRVRAEAERTARHEARRELLQAVIDGTSDPILARDLAGRFVLMNSAAAAALGIPSADDALTRSVWDVLPPDQARAVLAGDRAVLADGGGRVVQDRVAQASAASEPGPDAHPLSARETSPDRIFVTTQSLWRDADGRVAGVVCVSRDETARRAAEDRLEAVRAELVRAARLGAVGAMAAGLSHELNQPLGAAANFLAAAEAVLDPAGAALDLEGARDAVADAGREALRAGEIVRRLRNFVAQGDAELRLEGVGEVVAEACAAALPPMQASAGHAAVPVRIDVDQDAGAALVDRVQIQQVVINLVRNAAEAIRSGDRTERDRGGVAVHARRASDGGCEVAVVDSGPGIAPEVRHRLFEPFTTTKASGMGLGLAICRTIVEAHGGRLWADANPGGGAVFRFTLPPPLTSTGGHGDDGSA